MMFAHHLRQKELAKAVLRHLLPRADTPEGWNELAELWPLIVAVLVEGMDLCQTSEGELLAQAPDSALTRWHLMDIAQVADKAANLPCELTLQAPFAVLTIKKKAAHFPHSQLSFREVEAP